MSSQLMTHLLLLRIASRIPEVSVAESAGPEFSSLSAE
jgi:hypothetical protein